MHRMPGPAVRTDCAVYAIVPEEKEQELAIRSMVRSIILVISRLVGKRHCTPRPDLRRQGCRRKRVNHMTDYFRKGILSSSAANTHKKCWQDRQYEPSSEPAFHPVLDQLVVWAEQMLPPWAGLIASAWTEKAAGLARKGSPVRGRGDASILFIHITQETRKHCSSRPFGVLLFSLLLKSGAPPIPEPTETAYILGRRSARHGQLATSQAMAVRRMRGACGGMHSWPARCCAPCRETLASCCRCLALALALAFLARVKCSTASCFVRRR